jgi:hypothetical protein
MPITWEKLENFIGTRTTSMPDPDNEGQTIDSACDCNDVQVRFTNGTITHERYVNVCYDDEGNYDESATDARIEEVARGVEHKITVGVITAQDVVDNTPAP